MHVMMHAYVYIYTYMYVYMYVCMYTNTQKGNREVRAFSHLKFDTFVIYRGAVLHAMYSYPEYTHARTYFLQM